MIIGRDESENAHLQALQTPKYEKIELFELVGAFSLLSANADEKDLSLALKIALTYAKTSCAQSYKVGFKDEILSAKPFESKGEIQPFLVC